MTWKVPLAAAALALFGTASLADPILGVWQTEPDDGGYAHIQMEPCGAALCGKIARTFDATGEVPSDLKGKMIVMDLVPKGDGAYEGRVWRPSNDRVYLAKLDVNGNSLQLRGCVAGGLFCAKQVWSRVK